MALEKAGGENLDRLIKKIKDRYPNHNFDIPSMPSTKCKFTHRCNKEQPVYYDNDGNYYCAVMDKVVTNTGSMKTELQGCNAYLVELTHRKDEEKRRNANTPIF